MREIEANILSDTEAVGGYVQDQDISHPHSPLPSTWSSDNDLSVADLILRKLKETFDRDGNILNDPDSAGNVWVMLAVVIPFPNGKEAGGFMPHSVQKLMKGGESDVEIAKVPTHVARVVLRTTDARVGTSRYVDGSDFCFTVDKTKQTAYFTWEEESIEDAPKFHGGDIPSVLDWVLSLNVPPHYTQFKDPFLTPEQRTTLNRNEEGYASEKEASQTPPPTGSIEDWI
jgi:hypothetical protein